MNLLIVSNAPVIYKNNKAFAYSPYVKELIVWEKYTNITFCSPVWKDDKGLFIEEIPFEIKEHYKLFDNNLKSLKAVIKSFFLSVCNIYILIKAMNYADHIHLRCPGNIGLLGCIVQIFFPHKIKTAKYAGNWDPKSKQPFTYRLQKWILNNTFLTRNMQVLVYGEWENASSNIKTFFTGSYYEMEKLPLKALRLTGIINFLFVGTLTSGKNPLYAIQLVENLFNKGYRVSLNLYGDGVERKTLEKYILSNKLEGYIILKGNQNQKIVTQAYQKSHFVILPSKSEGWPKAIAEGMFWGCVPIATKISCVPYMLEYGKRGILLEKGLKEDIQQLEEILNNIEEFDLKRKKASKWSRQFTLDVFESEIKKMIIK